ncbi:MAG: 2-hydroxyhepta-2,4-diene-1,7-dioate isomerase [Caldilineae bacterium]|nr:MAG: 2-hydroxyhepta-2,4-diene-1,7-dioate isomerase [Caldilineae bacterium]
MTLLPEPRENRIYLLRFHRPGAGPRLGVLKGAALVDVTEQIGSLATWLCGSCGRVEQAIAALREIDGDAVALDDLAVQPDQQRPYLLAPVDRQDVWAAGVTYERSREARQQEAIDGGDVYARVYASPRPELFFKAHASGVVGPGQEVGIRHDATWSVPEPELGLVVNPAGEVAGLVIGNDMSSRDIEGENPLYLPQAKIYTASCALGPCILLAPVQERWPELAIRMHIRRDGHTVFTGETHTARIRRSPQELVHYLTRSLAFPDGVVLLTGTGIVPPDEFGLQAGDEISITIDGLGTLENRVKVV